jgi:hypothetical protein
MRTAIADLFESLEIRPVLVEIGSSQETNDSWGTIAPYSTYVAIGPESGTVSEEFRCRFREFIPIDSVVTLDRSASQTTLHVAKDSVYSGLLPPNAKVVTEFFDLNGVATERDCQVPCSPMDKVLAGIKIDHIDWFKTNINGLDAPVLRDLDCRVRRRILAIDTCLDFVDVYDGQDASLAQHPKLVGEGFWLSRVLTCGGIKLRGDSLQKLRKRFPAIDSAAIEAGHRLTPGWLFATYLRDLDSMRGDEFTRREYVLLWSFALLDRQYGFAADIAFAYEAVFGADAISRRMVAEAVDRLEHLKPRVSPLRKAASAVIPRALKRRLRSFLLGT